MTQTKTTVTIKCDWCQCEDCRDTGGVEWSGHAIYVCQRCGHEWVETSVKKKESEFLTNVDQIVRDFRRRS